MNDLTRDRLGIAPSAGAPVAPRTLSLPAAVPTGAQVELQETPAAEQPDLLARQVGLELADVWGAVTGQKPRPKGTAAPTLPQGQAQSGIIQVQLGRPGEENPAQGFGPVGRDPEPQSSKPPEESPREVAAAAPEVQEAGKTATDSATGAATDPSAGEAAKTETAAQEASTEQKAQVREESETREARAETAQDTARVERKEAEVTRQERELTQKESRLGELREVVSAKAQQVQELQGRVRQKERTLAQIDADINAISSAEDYLEHADEVERLHTMRYHVKLELEHEKEAARRAEADLRAVQRQAGELESSLDEGKRRLESRRFEVDKERSSLEARESRLEAREERLAQKNQALGSVEALRPFWSALSEGGLEEVAREAGAARLDVETREADATRRILGNLAALGSPDASLDLVQGLDLTRATRSERALADMQLPLEKARGASSGSR